MQIPKIFFVIPLAFYFFALGARAAVRHSAVPASVERNSILRIDAEAVVTQHLVDRAYEALLKKIKTQWIFGFIAAFFALLAASGLGIPKLIRMGVSDLAVQPVREAIDAIQSERDNIIRQSAEFKVRMEEQAELARELREEKKNLALEIALIQEESEKSRQKLVGVQKDAEATAEAVKNRLKIEIEAGNKKYEELKSVVSIIAKGQGAIKVFEEKLAAINEELNRERKAFDENSKTTIHIMQSTSRVDEARRLETFLLSRGFRVVKFPPEAGTLNTAMRGMPPLKERISELAKEIQHIVQISDVRADLSYPVNSMEFIFGPNIQISLGNEFERELARRIRVKKGGD